MPANIAVIIPVLNEEHAIGKVIDDIPRSLDPDIVVVDNGSTDRTFEAAGEHGARVVFQPERGYGAACLAGMEALNGPEIVVFLDGDYSDHPEEMTQLIAPILRDEADFVLGSRMIGEHERGSLPPHSIFGNWLAARLLNLFFGQRVTDMGPFRAIRYDALKSLGMQDRNFGWTVEMQAKAALQKMRVVEIPARYRKRVGRSKITGSLVNSLRAGATIIAVLFRLWLRSRIHPTFRKTRQ